MIVLGQQKNKTKKTPKNKNKQTNKPKKRKRTYKIVDFAVPADHRVKLKESEKDKYLDLARELK